MKTYVTHGYRHPLVAAKNAREDYGINDIEENIITAYVSADTYTAQIQRGVGRVHC